MHVQPLLVSALLAAFGLAASPALAQAKLTPHSYLDCFEFVADKAPIFAVDAPKTARAGTPVTLTAWVYNRQVHSLYDEAIARTFKATVDRKSHRIVVTGQIQKVRPHPDFDCRLEPVPEEPVAQPVPLTVSLPAGTWTVVIPPSHYLATIPPIHARPTPPRPASTRVLVVR